jgi:predicted outer membrane repeat protein
MKICSLPCICAETGLRSAIENNDSNKAMCSGTHIELSEPIDITGKGFSINCEYRCRKTLIGCIHNDDNFDCAISGRGSHRLFYGSPERAGFNGIEFQNGYADNGGVALLTGGFNVFSRCKFYGNKATGNGGAISATGNGTRVYLSLGNSFRDNSASFGGAIYVADGAYLAMIGPEIDENAHYLPFVSNSATADGGAIAFKNGSAAIGYSVFTGNMATGNGGAISATGPWTEVNIDSLTSFDRNVDAKGHRDIYVADGAIVRDDRL